MNEKKRRVYLVVEGGVLTSVGCRRAADNADLEFVLVDYDCEGADDIVEIRQSSEPGDTAEARIALLDSDTAEMYDAACDDIDAHIQKRYGRSEVRNAKRRRYPSVYALQTCTGCRELAQAEVLRKMLLAEDDKDVLDVITANLDLVSKVTRDSAPREINEAWHRYIKGCGTLDTMKLSFADILLSQHGVEHANEHLSYVNTGETYKTTLCLFNGNFVVRSWGDIVERNPRLFRHR